MEQLQWLWELHTGKEYKPHWWRRQRRRERASVNSHDGKWTGVASKSVSLLIWLLVQLGLTAYILKQLSVFFLLFPSIRVSSSTCDSYVFFIALDWSQDNDNCVANVSPTVPYYNNTTGRRVYFGLKLNFLWFCMVQRSNILNIYTTFNQEDHTLYFSILVRQLGVGELV